MNIYFLATKTSHAQNTCISFLFDILRYFFQPLLTFVKRSTFPWRETVRPLTGQHRKDLSAMKFSHRSVSYAAATLALGQLSQAEQNHAKRDAVTPNCPLNVTNVTGADPGLATIGLLDHGTKIFNLNNAATPDTSSSNSTNSTGAEAEGGSLTAIPSASFWTQNIATGNDTVWAVVYNACRLD